MPDKLLPELLSLREVSKILHCHPNTLRLWDKNGLLKAVRYGTRGNRKYRREDIETFIQDTSTPSLSSADTDVRESTQRYSEFIQQSSEGIWRFELEKPAAIRLSISKLIDHFYTYAYLAECNNAMAHMYGFHSSDELKGARLGDFLIRTDQNNIDYLTAFITSGYRLLDAESHEVDKEGNEKYFLNNLVGILDNGNLLRAWGIQRDITEKKQREKQKDEFIGIASHELKTPVTSAKAYAQILLQNFDKTKDKHSAELVKKMEAQLNRLAGLVTDLLDVTKIEAGNLQLDKCEFDINELIHEITFELATTSVHHKILKKLYTSKIIVYGDRERIGQVLINLLTNAIKYSPENTPITISSSIHTNEVIICIKDQGIGIEKEKQKQIFERYYRVSSHSQKPSSGLGLGLYISSEIIRHHHGNIWVESPPNGQKKGSMFCFSIRSSSETTQRGRVKHQEQA